MPMGCPSNLYEINVDRVHTFILVETRVKMVPKINGTSLRIIMKKQTVGPVSTEKRGLIDCIMFIVSFENISPQSDVTIAGEGMLHSGLCSE